VIASAQNPRKNADFRKFGRISKATTARHPLTAEIRLEKFGSQDLSVFMIDLLSDGESTDTRKNAFEILVTP